MGRIDERNNPFRIRAAAFKSLAENVVHKLPNRYDQMLGCRFEGGVDLSGGEWQKIALARAYLRDAQLLILDEPTAALDARSEHEVFQRFAELTKGKMSVLISHRFSTVRMSDRILVLENGTIAEQGGHNQLLRSGGSLRGDVRTAGGALPLIRRSAKRFRPDAICGPRLGYAYSFDLQRQTLTPAVTGAALLSVELHS